MKTIIHVLLVLIWCLEVNAQTDTLNQDQIREDTDIFIAALKEVHPGLDIYLKKRR